MDSSHRFKANLSSGISASLAVFLTFAGVAPLHADMLVTLVKPQTGVVVDHDNYPARVRLGGTADPHTLRVSLNGRDVTGYFNVAACASAPCDLTAALTFGSGAQAGWNALTASVNGRPSSAQSARMRFFVKSLGDPTTGIKLPYEIQVQQYGSNIIIESPTQLNIPNCVSPEFRVTDLDRSLLKIRQSQCLSPAAITPYLQTLNKTDLVVITSNPTDPLPPLDFSPIGGSNFILASLFPLNRMGYSVIGYGGASAGTAYEAWQVAGDDLNHYKSLNGMLINIQSSDRTGQLFAFQPTNNEGFTIIPGAQGTPGNPGLPAIYVGNVVNVPLGTSPANPPPNQTRPVNSNTNQELFSSQTYTPSLPANSSAAGGFFLLTLNRSDLTLFSSRVFMTNCACTDHTNDNAQITALAAALAEFNPNRLFMLTTIGLPFNADSNDVPLLNAISGLGVSPYALQGIVPDRLGNAGTAGFSMVAHNLYTPGEKMYSSAGNTQQNETGALTGVFVKRHNAFYEAVNVAPFDATSVPLGATADDYLRGATSFAITSASPVAWPHSTTPAEQAAYAYLSNQLVSANLYCNGVISNSCKCTDSPIACSDVRSYYTGSQAQDIYSKVQPSAITYPGDGNGYLQSDYTNVQSQLGLEAVYLSDVLAYEQYVAKLNTGSSITVGSALQAAAADLTTTLNTGLGQPDNSEAPIQIATDAFNIGAAAVSIFGAIPGFGPMSGVFWTISSVLQAFNDSAGKSPDPYVVQLQELLNKNSNAAATQAIAFNTDTEAASGIFFDGVYSDWFKLQTVGLLAVNTNAAGWYSGDTGNLQTNFLAAMTATERAKLYIQTVPQYVKKMHYTGIASGYLEAKNNWSVSQVENSFSQNYVFIDLTTGYLNHPLSDYSWDNRTSPGSAVCEDFTYMTIGYNGTWPSSLGDTLMGPPNRTDGLGNLNLDRNFFYELPTIPWFTSPQRGLTWPRPVQNRSLNGASSFACAAYPEPWKLNLLQPVFTNLSASQRINAGAASIQLSGNIAAGSAIPSGNVAITIDNVTVNANIGSDGSFSTTFVTHGLPAAPAPYVIKYSYDESAKFFGASDQSTTLTVLSTGTTAVVRLFGPSIYGQQAIMQATVSSPAGMPTGTVQFLDGALPIGTAGLVSQNSGAIASLSNTTLAAGVHPISAVYSGDSTFGPSLSTPVNQIVNKAQPYFELLSAPASVNYFTAIIPISGALIATNVKPPAGETVSVQIGAVTQTAQIGANGGFALQFLAQGLPAGNYKINLNYNGDANFLGALDSSQTLNIIQIAPVFSGLTSPKIQAGAQSVQLKGILSGGGAIPTGSVTATINGITSPAAPVQAKTGAFAIAFPTANIPASATGYKITYKYAGDTNFAGQTDATTTLTVSGLPTPAFSGLNPAPQIFAGAASVQLSGVVSAGNVYPAAGENVSITIGTAKGTGTFGANGVFTGSVPTSGLTTASYPVVYSYGGDSSLGQASDASTKLTVVNSPVQTQVTLTATPNPAALGQTVTFQATVAQVGSVVPTGNVTISEYPDPVNNPNLVYIYGNANLVNGVATIPVTSSSRQPLAAGTHTVVATYGGGSEYPGGHSAGYTIVITLATSKK